MLFFVLILIIVFLFLLNIELKRLKFHKQFEHIHSLEEYPVIGNLPFLKLKKGSDFIQLAQRLGSKPITKFTAIGSSLFVINDPVMLQKVLLSPVFYKRSKCMRYFEMENALFTTKYENWKPIRKPLNVAFTTKRVSQLIPKINKHTDLLCDQLNVFTNKGEFDLFKPVSHSEMDLIFGRNIMMFKKNLYSIETFFRRCIVRFPIQSG